MKTHTIAAVAGLALALCSQAEPTLWFDAEIDQMSDWPAQGPWSYTDNVTISGGKLVLENATNLTYTAASPKSLGAQTVIIESQMLFTAYDFDDMPEPPENIRAGLIVVDDGESTNYYGLVTNVWTKFTGGPAPDLTNPVTVKMSLLSDMVQYMVGSAVLTVNGQSWLAYNPPANNINVSEVLYKGTGEVCSLVGTTDALPEVQVTLSWPSSLASVSYTVDGVAGSALTVDDGTAAISAVPGSTIVLTGSVGAGYPSKTVTGTVSGNGTFELPAVDISYYFPLTATAGQDGSAEHPYEIANAFGLNALKDAVKNVAAARSLCYLQTANIDMSTAGAFAGIGTYNATPTDGTPFTGTYDGGGYKIANVTMTARNYGGIFNQVNGGMIKNLAVENISVAPDATGEYGFAIIGNAGNGATLKNLVATGSFGSQQKPGTHNMAGIAIRLSAGGTGTLVQNCTNNAAIYGTYTKLAGICAITQVKVSGGVVTFDGCANNGSLVMPSGSTAGRDGLAGIVGYASDATVLVNCSNTGTMTTPLANAKIGELIGYSYAGYTLTDQGGNSGDATKKLVCEQAGTINGFKYATVSGNVATTVTTLAEGNTYLLEGNVAASETPVFTLAAADDTIAFDTALGYTFAGTVAAAEGLEVNDETVGTVTTYTAASAAPTALDPASGVTSVTIEAADEVAATNAVVITPPTGVSDAAAYRALFDIAAKGAGEEGKFVVSINGIKEEVVEGVNADVVNVFSGDTSVTVPAGLYYRITTGTSLPISGSGAATLSDGTAETVTKPGTTQGFIKVELDAQSFGAAVQ
ncbi:MAG: hypothetical protein K6G91_13865 [Kiritimatiellae bacterium]|nr:hypothetical protein [Kiritimatiellia bacterium]